MIFNFRKIASVLSSAVMVSSTMALAAASSFPAPFVQSGAADVAVVYGADAATTDLIAAVDIQSALSTELARQTASGSSTGSASISGEAAALFTSGTRLYINDSLNNVKNVLTDSELPIVLADGSFSGNVDASFTQQIEIGSNPVVTFAKQPTSSFDPAYGLTISTDTDQKYLYNSTVIFSKEVNLSHADSEGEDISIFGTTYTISSATDATDLVLLKSAEKLSLSSDDPVAEAIVAGNTYVIELVSASDTAATVKVTNSAGASESKEISESNSKKVNGITIAITNADETNLKLSASIVAGSDKITLTDNNNIKFGEDDTIIDGTEVQFEGAADDITSVTKIVVAVGAPDSDSDAILPETPFMDPVFGSFKLDFSGLNIADDSTVAREEIKVISSGDDKAQVTFEDYDGNSKTITFARNATAANNAKGGVTELGEHYTSNSSILAIYDDDGHNITVQEGKSIHYNDYVVVGNEDDGRIVKLSSIKNASETAGQGVYTNDRVEFTDVMSGDTYKATLTSEGAGTVSVKGRQYGVKYTGDSANATEEFNVFLDYPDSTTTTEIVLFPTIQTKNGAKLMFYTPVHVNLSNFRDTGIQLPVINGLGAGAANVTKVSIPDGDGYTSATITRPQNGGADTDSNYSIDGGTTNISSSAVDVVWGDELAVGELVFNFTAGHKNFSSIYLVTPADASSGSSLNLGSPAIVIFEEKDDNNLYEAQVVTLEEGGNGDDGLGINDVISTWDDSSAWEGTTPDDSNILKKGDLWGTIVTLDSGDSDQKQATISYPDEQVYAQIYIAEESASITAGTASGGSVTSLGNVLVTDAEASSVSSKNLIVVGGSCINSVAADLLGAGACGADFESTTGVGAGSFLIETFSRSSGKVATLVAGYNAGDTTNAAKYLTTQTVDTTAGKKYKGTSATSAELVTSTA